MRAATLAELILSGGLMSPGKTGPEPRKFFHEKLGLSDAQIDRIARGQAIVKMLPSRTPAEIFVFGAVFVNANPDEYIKFAFDMVRLRRLPGYLGVGRFSDPPLLSDLAGFTLEPGDIRDLKNCKPGSCTVQLPSAAMREIQTALDWSRPGAAAQVNARVRNMALDILQRYQNEGNSVLGIYRDSRRPFDVDAELRSLLGRAEALPVYLPELNHYLLAYPNAIVANLESLFYWERVNFGLKPTLRLNHGMSYRTVGPHGTAHVVAMKQLYASHYFQLALDLTVCLSGSSRAGQPGFYLITLKGSTQEGLTGFLGSVRRKIVVSKTLSAQEKALLSIKKTLEEKR